MTRSVPVIEEAAAEAGVAGNSRLTASTGLVLTALLLVEGFTILDIRGYITLHTSIGLALIGPLALKCATTIYRFARYYTRSPAYVRRGAPVLLLRMLGPVVVLSSLAVIGTGVALLADRAGTGPWVALHKASFVVWVLATGVHFLAHIHTAARETARDLRPATGDPARRARAWRLVLIAGSLGVGIAVAAVFTPPAGAWHLGSGG